MEKQEFIDKATQELGGDFFAKLDAEVLWGMYDRWLQSPSTGARPLYEAVHAAVESSLLRRNIPNHS